MDCDEDPLRRRPGKKDKLENATGGVCLNGEKNDRMAFQARADYQNYAIAWLQRGYRAHLRRSFVGECAF